MKVLKVVLISVLQVLVLTTICLAQADPNLAGQAHPPSFGEVLNRMLPMFAIVFLIFYFIVMKPAQSKIRAQQTLIEGLKKGEEVVTSSGLIGRIAAVEKGYIILELASNVRVKFEAAHVVKRYAEAAQSPAAEKAKVG